MYTFFGYCTPYALHNRYKKTNRSKVDAIPLVTPTTSIDISIRVCPLTPGLTRAMSRNDLSSVSTHTDRRLRTSLIAFVTEEERRSRVAIHSKEDYSNRRSTSYPRR